MNDLLSGRGTSPHRSAPQRGRRFARPSSGGYATDGLRSPGCFKDSLHRRLRRGPREAEAEKVEPDGGRIGGSRGRSQFSRGIEP